MTILSAASYRSTERSHGLICYMRESEFTTFGQWLRFYRTRRDFKMRQIGRLLGVSGQTVKNWEENPAGPDAIAPRPDRDLIRRFAELTGADAAVGERLGGYAADDAEAVLREMVGSDPSLDAIARAMVEESNRHPEPIRSIALRLGIEAMRAALEEGRMPGGPEGPSSGGRDPGR